MSNAPSWSPKPDVLPTTKSAIKVRAVAEWAQLRDQPGKPERSGTNEMSGKYQIVLTNLSAAAVQKLSDIGVDAKTRDDKPERGHFITPTSNNPINAYDANGNEIISAIGNGSEVEVVLDSYDWEFKGKKGTSPSIKKLTVTNLITFEADDNEFDELEAF